MWSVLPVAMNIPPIKQQTHDEEQEQQEQNYITSSL